jgi:hypothetical protein
MQLGMDPKNLTCVIMPGIERQTGGNPVLNKTLKDLAQLYYKKSPDCVPCDQSVLKILTQIEHDHPLVFPADLKTIVCWPGMSSSSEVELPLPGWMQVPSETKWSILSPFRNNSGRDHDLGLCLIDEDQGCCAWYVAWNKGDEHCRVYVCETDPEDQDFSPLEMKLTSISLIDFLWDFGFHYGCGH